MAKDQIAKTDKPLISKVTIKDISGQAVLIETQSELNPKKLYVGPEVLRKLPPKRQKEQEGGGDVDINYN